MNNDTITDYLLGQLSETERLDFEQQMANNPQVEQEVNELKAVLETLKNAEIATDKALDNAFYKLLEKEKSSFKKPIISLKPTISWGNYSRYAAAAVAMVGAFWAGRQTASSPVEYRTIAVVQPREIKQTTLPETALVVGQKVQKKVVVPKVNLPSVAKEMAELRKEVQLTQELVVLSLLKDPSASARLKGLNYASALHQPANLVIEALVKTLREDESVNVRLSAIEALEKFKMTGVLVGQLTQSNAPIEQLILIETLLRLRAKESLPAMQQLEKDPNTEQTVRFAARNGISELNAAE